MKFRYAQNHTVIQTLKSNQTGAVIGRFVVCKFDENGEFETEDPKLIHILKTKLPGCEWDEEKEQDVNAEEIREILSDEELEKEGLKRYSEMSYQELKKLCKERGINAGRVNKEKLIELLEV